MGLVLVVDDEACTRTALKRLLYRHTVHLAESGAQAMTMLASEVAYDVVLVDLQLPDMNGGEILEHLLETNPAQAEAVAFITASDCGPQPAHVFEKPFSPSALMRFVDERAARVR